MKKRLEPNVSNSFRVNCNEIAFIALMQTKYIHTSFIVFQCWKCSDEHIFNSIKLRMSKILKELQLNQILKYQPNSQFLAQTY